MTNSTMPLDGGGAELPVVTRAELGYDAPAAPAVEMRPLGSAPVGVDKAEADAGPPPASFAELYQFASGSEKLLLLFAVLCATGAGCSMPMMLIAFGSAFDQLGVAETLPGKSVIGEQMDKMLFTFVYIGVGMGLGKGLYIASVQYVCSSQMLKYKMAFLKAVLRQDVAWYDTSSPEELTTRFEEAMVKVQKGLSAPAFMFFEGLGYGLGSLVMAFVYEPVVAGITIAAVPLLIIPASLMMYLVEHGAKIVSSAYGKAGGIATEALFSMRTIVSLGLEERFEQRYSSSLAGARRATVKNMAAFGVSVGCALSAYLVMMVVAIIYGAFTLSQEMEKSEFDFIVPCREPWCGERTDNYYCAELGSNKLVSNQTWPCSAEDKLQTFKMSCSVAGAFTQVGVGSLGFESIADFQTFVQRKAPFGYENKEYFPCSINNTDVLLAIFAIMMAGEGLSMAGEPATKWSAARQAAAKVLDIINRLPAIDSFSEEGLKPSECRGEIEVKDVVFAYPTAVDHKVCNGLSLRIPPGTTMALCGASGSGKSTVIQLLERFYDPLSGVITMDGVDIKTLNVRWLRSQLGLVGQEPVLFQGTVAQNIAYGKLSGATQDEIEAAAKAANAHNFITSDLQNGYDTEVGLKGGFLSGGQKQRVAIARALIKKPAVLLLDEATSALDNTSEAVVQEALDDVMAKHKITTIVIAHRLSTIRNASCIAVFNEGRIVEQGSHEELLGHQGLYASLVLSHS